MITSSSKWTLPLCTDAASMAVAEHGLAVHGYIVGSAHHSAVRIHLLRAGVVVLHVQVGTDELEECADEAAVRSLVVGRILGVIEAARECGYDLIAEIGK